MKPTTRYQAVRTAMMELGPFTNPAEVAQYVNDQYGVQFENMRTVSLYIAMVNSKMSRKPNAGNNAPSGVYLSDQP